MPLPWFCSSSIALRTSPTERHFTDWRAEAVTSIAFPPYYGRAISEIEFWVFLVSLKIPMSTDAWSLRCQIVFACNWYSLLAIWTLTALRSLVNLLLPLVTVFTQPPNFLMTVRQKMFGKIELVFCGMPLCTDSRTNRCKIVYTDNR